MAKNITKFIPGFGTSAEMVDKCEMVWVAAAYSDSRSGNDYGTICGRWCWQCNHKYEGTVNIVFRGASGTVGGACCCSAGAGGVSGTVLNYEAQPTNSVTACDHAELCWRHTAGGCCYPGVGGGGEACRGWFKDTNAFGSNNNNYKWCSPSPMCVCSTCNDMQASCYSGGFPVVVHNSGMPYGATGCAGQAVDMYMNCFKQYADEGFTKSTYPFDSDTHIKPGRPGFRAYGYGTVYTGAQICYATTYMEFPAMRGNNKEHYIGSQMQGENCYGGWLQECMECAWFGMSTTVGATTPFQNVCTAGRSAHPATANGGNCYCSGPENGGKFLHMYYSLTEEITG